MDGTVLLNKFDVKERDVVVARWCQLFVDHIFKKQWYAFCECLRAIKKEYLFAWMAVTIGMHEKELGK